jgi:hypothetical protein
LKFVTDIFSDISGKWAIRLIIPTKRDANQIIVFLQVTKLHARKTQRQKRRVERDKSYAQIAVNPGMDSQGLAIEPSGDIGRVI